MSRQRSQRDLANLLLASFMMCHGQCSAFGTLSFGDFVAPVLISRVLFDGNVLHWRDVAPTWMQTQMFASKLATLHHLLLLMFKKKPFHCVFQSLNEDRLLGNIKNVAITAKKEQFVGKRFKATEMVEAVQIYKTKEVVYDVHPSLPNQHLRKNSIQCQEDSSMETPPHL
ncbi:uncharacterized protein LOC144079013 [Stigmatopora argus]